MRVTAIVLLILAIGFFVWAMFQVHQDSRERKDS